jgi:hypothetical protein
LAPLRRDVLVAGAARANATEFNFLLNYLNSLLNN